MGVHTTGSVPPEIIPILRVVVAAAVMGAIYWILRKIERWDRVQEFLVERDRFWAYQIGKDLLLVTRLLAFGVTAVIILQLVGIDIVEMLTTNVGTIVLGLLLTPLLGASINAIVIKRSLMLEESDLVQVEGIRGIVDDITMLQTVIITFNGGTKTIPHYQLRSRDIVNYTRDQKFHRISQEILITYETEVETAKDKIQCAAMDISEVYTVERANDERLSLSFDDSGSLQLRGGEVSVGFNPTCRIAAFADSGILLELYYWVREPCALGYVQANIRDKIRERFDSDELDFAYPHSQILFDDTHNEITINHKNMD